MAVAKPVIHHRDHEHGGADPVHVVWEDVGTSGGGTGGGGYATVQDEGTALPAETKLNFVGAGVTATDDAANTRTNVTIPGGYTTAQDEGTALPVRATINFVGAGVTATDDAANSRTNVSVLGGASGGTIDPVLTAFGFTAITGDPRYYAAPAANSSGTIRANGVWIPSGNVLTTMGLYMTNAGLAVTFCKVGVYNTAWTLLASSVNTAALPANTGWRTAALSPAWTCPANGLYYLAFIIVGSNVGNYMTTMPAAPPQGVMSQSPAPGTPFMWWTQGGQTDLTNPATPAQTAAQPPFVYAF